jgi:hypothetical protein
VLPQGWNVITLPERGKRGGVAVEYREVLGSIMLQWIFERGIPVLPSF